MRKSMYRLVFTVMIVGIFASSYGIFSHQGPGQSKFKTIYGETIKIYGVGLYKHDSIAMAEQAIAQDYVTLFVAIPLLILAIYLSKKERVKGKLLLTGTLGYFLYTYASYSFLSMYNSLFLIYILLMSTSFFAFVLAIMSFDISQLPFYFDKKLPVKFIGSFLLFCSFIFGMMWLGRILPSLINSEPPVGIDHYTTLIIQALDLGFVIPSGMLAGILLIKRRPFGYLIGSVLIIKFFMLLTALTAMTCHQLVSGVQISFMEIFIILLFNLLVIYCFYLIMRNVKEPIRR